MVVGHGAGVCPVRRGHRAGVENLRRIIDACVEFGIKILTIYAFSTENWGRPPTEVRALMRIFARVLDQEVYELHEQGVCLHHLGDLSGISPDLQTKVKRAIELTKNNSKLILNVAFNYGGRAEIIHAVKQLLQDGVAAAELTEDRFSHYLFTKGLPDPDLVIRPVVNCVSATFSSGRRLMPNTWRYQNFGLILIVKRCTKPC